MKYLILGPGGMAYFSMIGRVIKMNEMKQFEDLEEISGSSAGALCAFCYLVARKNLDSLIETSLNIKTDKVLKFTLKNLLKNFGGIDLKHARNSISEVCSKYIGISDVTFEHLYTLTGIKLHIPAYSLTKGTNVYFSTDATPMESVLDAVCASICLPLIMAPYKGEYLDGSIMEDIPYIPFLLKNPDDVYTIRVENNSLNGSTGMIGYLSKLMNVFYTLRYKTDIFKIDYIRPPNINTYKFSMDAETKMKLFLCGYRLT